MRAFKPIRRVRQYLRPRPGAGITVSDVITSGVDEPEGVVTGNALNQQYVQTDAGGTTVLTTWYFKGTIGTDTGWITYGP